MLFSQCWQRLFINRSHSRIQLKNVLCSADWNRRGTHVLIAPLHLGVSLFFECVRFFLKLRLDDPRQCKWTSSSFQWPFICFAIDNHYTASIINGYLSAFIRSSRWYTWLLRAPILVVRSVRIDLQVLISHHHPHPLLFSRFWSVTV